MLRSNVEIGGLSLLRLVLSLLPLSVYTAHWFSPRDAYAMNMHSAIHAMARYATVCLLPLLGYQNDWTISKQATLDGSIACIERELTASKIFCEIRSVIRQCTLDRNIYAEERRFVGVQGRE